MKFVFLFISFLFLLNCSKPKTVLICGDHVCVNDSEAERFFEENLSIEVKIINNKKKKEINLVELNLNDDIDGRREVSISPKGKINKKLKVLSDKEIIEIKKSLKDKKNEKKISKKVISKNKVNKKEKIVKDKIIKNNNISINNTVNKKRNKISDVCTKLEKCSIDEISKYLLKQGKTKDFPDITTRQ